MFVTFLTVWLNIGGDYMSKIEMLLNALAILLEQPAIFIMVGFIIFGAVKLIFTKLKYLY